MYTLEDIKLLSNHKQELINNYIKKFIASRWRDNKEYTVEECLEFLIVQEYIKQVVKLTDNKEDVINKYSVGCGGATNENS